MKTQKIKCAVSGKETSFSKSYLQKKIKEYGSQEKMERLYVSRDVKSYLLKGNKIDDISKLLNITVEISDKQKKEIESFYQKDVSRDMTSFNNTLTAFTHDKSDQDVENFINKYII